MRVLCGPAGELKAPAREKLRGVRVRRVFGVRAPESRFGRLFDYLAFHVCAGLRILFARADVIVTLTTPPLLGFWGSLARRVRRARHVIFLMDHHPDAEFELGVLRRGSFLGHTLETLYRFTLRGADRVVCLGPYMARRVARRGVPPERVSIVPIWSCAREIWPVPHAENPVRRRWDWGDRFVVLYAGNAGLVHRFDELLAAMERMDSEDPTVLFAFAGGGRRAEEIGRFAAERGLANVTFVPSVDRFELSYLLSAADVHFVSLRPEHVGVSVPGKLYGQLASGRPILFVGPTACETAEDLTASGAGIVVLPGETDRLVSALRYMRRKPEDVQRMGAKGREWFLANREKGAACETWRRLLERVVVERGSRHAVPTADPAGR